MHALFEAARAKVRRVFPAVVFKVNTAKRRGRPRYCAVPIDPKYEPWAMELFKYFEDAGEEKVFPFGRQNVYRRSKKVWKDLAYVIEDYSVSINTQGAIIGIDTEKKTKRVDRHLRNFTTHALRHVRATDLVNYCARALGHLNIVILMLSWFSLIAIFFPRNDDLGWTERVALSFGLSIAVVPFLGWALNYTPFGIRRTPILIVLSTFAISLSIVAWFRRLKLTTEERFRVPFEKLLKFNLGQRFLDKGLSILLIVSIIGSSATLVYVVVTPKTGERFTEFYLIGPNGTASDYPTDLKIGEEGKLIIGIVNYEYENVTYRLEVNFNGSLIHEEYIFLIEKEKWESPFIFKATNKGENKKLEFLLYKDQQIEVYRTLHMWISVT